MGGRFWTCAALEDGQGGLRVSPWGLRGNASPCCFYHPWALGTHSALWLLHILSELDGCEHF